MPGIYAFPGHGQLDDLVSGEDHGLLLPFCDGYPNCGVGGGYTCLDLEQGDLVRLSKGEGLTNADCSLKC